MLDLVLTEKASLGMWQRRSSLGCGGGGGGAPCDMQKEEQPDQNQESSDAEVGALHTEHSQQSSFARKKKMTSARKYTDGPVTKFLSLMNVGPRKESLASCTHHVFQFLNSTSQSLGQTLISPLSLSNSSNDMAQCNDPRFLSADIISPLSSKCTCVAAGLASLPSRE